MYRRLDAEINTDNPERIEAGGLADRQKTENRGTV